MVEKRNAYSVLVGQPEGNRPLGGSKHRWKNNIKMDLREIRLVVWTGFNGLGIKTSGGLL
jgi:hypothetical protein